MIRSFFISSAEVANWVIGRKSPDKKILSWKVVFANFPQKDDDLRISLPERMLFHTHESNGLGLTSSKGSLQQYLQ
ncbi:hypothetical protein PVK06_042901 [Gossypium arboreum]|uniref:Uncharacterized protein n=1 Tax=Gossypium arboreum TaxID=29729 RepID=A0ABR0MM18_GOSAR|nr:hypothetical protein PVK06_042901 [Gossypium arboreum]